MREKNNFKGLLIGLSDSAFLPDLNSQLMRQVTERFKSAKLFWQSVTPEMGCNMGETEGWRCLFMQEITKKLQNPMYVVQSGYDCEHLKLALAASKQTLNMTSGNGFKQVTIGVENASPSQPAASPQHESRILNDWAEALLVGTRHVQQSSAQGIYINRGPYHNQVISNDRSPTTSTAEDDLEELIRSPQEGACDIRGGWSKGFVRVGCQRITLKESFGDWYFSYSWAGEKAEYATVVEDLGKRETAEKTCKA